MFTCNLDIVTTSHIRVQFLTMMAIEEQNASDEPASEPHFGYGSLTTAAKRRLEQEISPHIHPDDVSSILLTVRESEKHRDQTP